MVLGEPRKGTLLGHLPSRGPAGPSTLQSLEDPPDCPPTMGSWLQQGGPALPRRMGHPGAPSLASVGLGAAAAGPQVGLLLSPCSGGLNPASLLAGLRCPERTVCVFPCRPAGAPNPALSARGLLSGPFSRAPDSLPCVPAQRFSSPPLLPQTPPSAFCLGPSGHYLCPQAR